MPLIPAAAAPTFDLPGVRFTGLAAPSRGARETAVWTVRLAPGTPATLHRVTREEIFVALAGAARATVGGVEVDVTPGSALVVPPDTEFGLANPHAEPFEAVVVLPVGGQAVVGEERPFTPPWAE